MSAEAPRNDFVLVTGIHETGTPEIRKEFSEWATDKPGESIQVSLFIRAMQRFYERDYKETLSYFQVASIHGYPGSLQWDGSAPPSFPSGDKSRYLYCTHNTLAFPTWHRPYMVLFEQTVFQLMGEVIANLEFSSEGEKEIWVNESKRWRLPYWDWAVNTSLPQLFREKTVNIREPLKTPGTQATSIPVSNPLYRFEMKVKGKVTKMGDLEKEPINYCVNDVPDGDDILPWSKCSGTSRWGITSDDPTEDQSEGITNSESIGKAIQTPQWYGYGKDDLIKIRKYSVSDLVYRLLTNVETWASFSSTVTSGPKKDESTHWEQWISLEYIHNNLHGFIGGAGDFDTGLGHMMNVPVAAFDPIFYMHHCFIDRLFAIWQAMHKDTWFKDPEEAKHKLTPFHHLTADNKVDYFDSNDVENWTQFGYQYDVLVRKPGQTDQEYLDHITKYVNTRYRGTGDVLLKDSGSLFSLVEDSQAAKSGHQFDDYVINVQYDRYGYRNGSPYTIHFFLGGPMTKTDPSVHTTGLLEAPYHVGSVFTFSSSTGGDGDSDGDNAGLEAVPKCANCVTQHDDGVLSRAAVPLTLSLYTAATSENFSEINDIVPDDVEPFLQEKLSWVAVNTRGKVIPWSELPKTRVYVLKGKAQHYHNDFELSNYQNYEPIESATHGKEAGALREEY